MRDNLGMMAVNLSVHVKMVVQECTNVLQSKSFMCIGYEMSVIEYTYRQYNVDVCNRIYI